MSTRGFQLGRYASRLRAVHNDFEDTYATEPAKLRSVMPLSHCCYTHAMSKRLQVLFDEAELDQLRETARRHGIPVSEWVRQALRAARRQDPHADVEAKVRALRAAVRHEFPTTDVDQMLAEIERGYGVD